MLCRYIQRKIQQAPGLPYLPGARSAAYNQQCMSIPDVMVLKLLSYIKQRERERERERERGGGREAQSEQYFSSAVSRSRGQISMDGTHEAHCHKLMTAVTWMCGKRLSGQSPGHHLLTELRHLRVAAAQQCARGCIPQIQKCLSRYPAGNRFPSRCVQQGPDLVSNDQTQEYPNKVQCCRIVHSWHLSSATYTYEPSAKVRQSCTLAYLRKAALC